VPANAARAARMRRRLRRHLPRMPSHSRDAAASASRQSRLAHVSIRQHTSAYAAYVSIRSRRTCVTSKSGEKKSPHPEVMSRTCANSLSSIARSSSIDSAYVSKRQHTSAYVSIRQHASAYVSGPGSGAHDTATTCVSVMRSTRPCGSCAASVTFVATIR
jgi:hypothetical protein